MTRYLRSMFAPAAAVLAVGTLIGCATRLPPTPAPVPGSAYTPVQRFEQLDRVAMQIVRGTATTPEDEYQGRVRPQLLGQLARLGFSHEEVGQILTRVDGARADRQRVRQLVGRRDRPPNPPSTPGVIRHHRPGQNDVTTSQARPGRPGRRG